MTGGGGFFHLQLPGMSGAERFPPRTLQTEQTVKRVTHVAGLPVRSGTTVNDR